jgi:hypothetical protein
MAMGRKQINQIKPVIIVLAAILLVAFGMRASLPPPQ